MCIYIDIYFAFKIVEKYNENDIKRERLKIKKITLFSNEFSFFSLKFFSISQLIDGKWNENNQMTTVSNIFFTFLSFFSSVQPTIRIKEEKKKTCSRSRKKTNSKDKLKETENVFLFVVIKICRRRNVWHKNYCQVL